METNYFTRRIKTQTLFGMPLRATHVSRTIDWNQCLTTGTKSSLWDCMGMNAQCWGLAKFGVSARCFSLFSLMSVAAGQGYQHAHIYTWGVFEKYCIKTQNGVLGTMDTFFALLKWSFQCMFDGTWPTHDWRGCKYSKKSKDGSKAGKPLANGRRACLIQLAGDLDYRSKWFDAPRWSTHSKPCSIYGGTCGGLCDL